MSDWRPLAALYYRSIQQESNYLLDLQSTSVSDEDGELEGEEDGQVPETKKERRMRQQKEKLVRSPNR